MNARQKLIEFYEMVSVNDAALGDSEKTAIRRAGLALSMFERAMERFTLTPDDAPAVADSWLAKAA